MNIPIILLLSASLVGTDKPDRPVKVETWHDHAVAFSTLRTFDFDHEATTRNRSGRPSTSQGFTRDAEIREMIVTSLERRGYHHAPDDEVDFLVVCHFRPPAAPGRRGSKRRAGVAATFSLTFGKSNDNAVYIEFREPEQRLPIWRGTGLRVQVRKATIAERLGLAIDTVLAAFPPPPHVAPIPEQNDAPTTSVDGDSNRLRR